MEKTPLYSPTQVGIGTLVGGPIAAIYFLRANFVALGDAGSARATLIWGMLLVIALLIVVPFLPDKFPNFVIPVAYAIAARTIAEKQQMTKAQIEASERYTFQSTGNVVVATLVFFAVLAAILFVWIYVLVAAGVVKL